MNLNCPVIVFRRRKYDENFTFMRQVGTQRNAKSNLTYQDNDDEGVGNERDSLESSEISAEAFSNRYAHQQTNNFNQVTQYIQNNNNKITIIIKHDSNNNDGPNQRPPATEQKITPQIIYIQPASSQPNLHANTSIRMDNENVYNSLDDLDSDEHYQFYNESAIDVPDDFKRNSYLVLNFNNAANKKLRRRICTPTRNLLPTIDDDDDLIVKSNRNNFFKKEVKKVRDQSIAFYLFVIFKLLYILIETA